MNTFAEDRMTTPPTLSDAELDLVYTELCRTLTALGPSQTPLVLARFALLAVTRIGDAAVLRQMIEDAAQGLGPDGAGA
jgi:hypothetical protein